MSVTILLLTEVFPPRTGGSGRWFWELYRRFPAGAVHIAAARDPGAGEWDRSSGLSIDRLPLRLTNWGLLDPRGGWQYARAFAALWGVVSRERPGVIHCGKCLPEGLLGLGLARARSLPFWCYAHGEELTLARTSRELAWLTSRVLQGADRVIANSRFTRDLLLDDWAVPASKIVVMHPGVDTERFRPAPADPGARERLGWTGRRVVLTVGALQRRKGQDMMIRALPAIRQRCPNVLYAIAGEGWERAELERLVAECGAGDLVQFRGVPRDEELVECYQQCDVFALPNRRIGWDVEGFGIVLLEAQACGKPVIAGMSGGTVDTLEPGRTGALVNCETPEAVAQAVIDFVADPVRASVIGERARRWAVDRFDWQALTREAVASFGIAGSSVTVAERS